MMIRILILLVLMVASVAGFWARFRRVVKVIAAAKPDPGLQLKDIPRRVGQFVSEVMLQSKVIRERPLPGIAHAFVFWGFCAFALISINHFGQGFGITLLHRDSGFGYFYHALVAVIAAAVAVSIAGLAIRRFVVRPRWLGITSPESGVIALLIFLLMITYLAALTQDEGTAVWWAIWWCHTLTLLAFLPLIPHTKHLHLVLSPATIFARREGFSDIPPLAGDEDFGLTTGKDVTKIDALQAFSCVECGRCSEHCPAFNTGKALNPKEVILGMRGYLKEEGPASESPLLGKFISQEAVFQCTTCGACEYQCPVGIQHLPMMIGLRRGAVNTGAWEDDHGAKFFNMLERSGNSLGFASSERMKFIEKNELPIYDGTQEYCLWLGCMGAYDPSGREIILALVKVLRHLNISFGVLRKERCTGDPARRLGNDLLFSQLAAAGIENVKESVKTRMLSICPHCVRTIGTDWKEYGQSFAIEHHTELLARCQAQLPAAGGGRETVVYHDPCYLGRYRGTYDEPRNIVSCTADLVEAPRHRERSFCCGAGGGMMFLGEEKGDRVNMTRAKELAATGASTVGTACPFCQSMFRDALQSVSQEPPKLLDVVQIIAAPLK